MRNGVPENLHTARGAKTPLFYGWRMVASIFVIMTFTSGLCFYNISVLLTALTREQGFSVSLASGVTAVFFLSSGFSGMIISRLIERFDPRATMIGGCMLAALSMFMLAHVQTVWQVYVVYGFFGFGFAACNMVPGATLIARWFERGRAKALSIASTGLSLGGILLTPISAKLISDYGLGAAMPWIAGLYLIGVIPAALLLKPYPAVMGLGPDGDPPHETIDGKAAPRSGALYADAIRSRFFRFSVVSYLLIMLAQVGTIAHHFNLIATRIDIDTAATAITLLAGSSAAGRLLGGWFASHNSLRLFTICLMIAQSGAQFILGYGDSTASLFTGSIIYGLTIGNILMLMPLLYAQAFGLRNYSRIYSLGNMVSTIGMAAGPLAIGLTHDWLGGYGGAYVFAAVVSLLSAALFFNAGPVPNPDD